MKRIAIGLGLFTMLLLLNFPTPTRAEKTTGDEAAVHATVTDYIEGYFNGDAARMEKSIHPHYLKHTISGQEGALRMTEKTGLQMVQDVRAKGGSRFSETDRKQQITVL
ncbi:MAG TPA: nuclear transport factor 2 family protein, partial [Candidatus Angelobacter sp.]|nr:nuclear transport factor 2 family protein [Candidatus Angelobacter sp.]